MALDNFIPEVWTARLLERLAKAFVYGQAGVANRDYEGEISAMGDTVRINSIGPVTVSTYTKNTDHPAAEVLSDAALALQITESKMFSFQVDDVDVAQQKPKVMDSAMREAAFALRNTTDLFLAAMYWAEADVANGVGTNAAPKTDLATAGKPYQYLVDLGVFLDENDTPNDGRWVIVPPWYHGLLLQDEKFVKSGTPAGDEVLRNGVIGEAAGFTVLKSNNVPNTANDNYKIVAGHPIAVTFADQVNKTEALRMERRFADQVRGLHLYGAKVLRSSNLAVLHADRP